MLASLAAVTASSAILEVITALAPSSVAVTLLAAILAEVTESSCNIAVVTVLLLGVPMFTVLPKTTAWYVLPVAGAAPNLIVLPSKANPSEGVDVPALGFCATPLITNNTC